MSAGVDYFYSDELYQGIEFLSWTWPLNLPAEGRYWSLAVVPEYANVAACELLRYSWSSDNSDQFHLTASFDVQADSQHLDINLKPDYIIKGGIFFGIKAIRAPSA